MIPIRQGPTYALTDGNETLEFGIFTVEFAQDFALDFALGGRRGHLEIVDESTGEVVLVGESDGAVEWREPEAEVV